MKLPSPEGQNERDMLDMEGENVSTDVLSVSEITDYCERAVETLHKVQRQCLERATEMDLAAYAWFCQQERIYGYEIPNTIRAILEERKRAVNADQVHGDSNGA